MSYRIPKDDDVAEAVANCLIRYPRVRSQTAFCRIVAEELANIDPEYRIGMERIRRIGIRRGLLNVEITYAHTGGPNPYTLCPVCGGKLESVRNKTLEGETVELSRNCGVCGYSAKSDACRPARYVITRRD